MTESQAQNEGELPVSSPSRCRACGHDNVAGSRYCSQCGIRVGTASLEELDGPDSNRATGFGAASEVRASSDDEAPIADPSSRRRRTRT